MAYKTFGGVLSIYDSTYKVIGGLQNCTFPGFEADDPQVTTCHASSGGVEELIPTGTFKWPDLTFDCLYLSGDTGQTAVAANIGNSMKFKFVSASGRTLYCNAIITHFAAGAQPVKGTDLFSGIAKPYGVAPVS